MNLSPPVWPLARTSEQPQSRCTDKACICKQLAFVRKVMVWARAPGEPLPARVAPGAGLGPLSSLRVGVRTRCVYVSNLHLSEK